MEDNKLNLATLANFFADEDAARTFLESKRWPGGYPVCPRCGSEKAYALTPREGSKKPVRKGVYCCAACRRQFTVRIGTVFEASHIPLRKWLMAIHLMTSSKKGVSSLQLSRELGITVKSAWFLSHRIREAMTERAGGFLSGTVEVDETYVGAKPRKGTGPHKRGRGTTKTPVVVLVERDGRAHTSRVDRLMSKHLKGIIKTHVSGDSKIVTDEPPSYKGIGKEFQKGHSVVNHSKDEYVNGEGEHVNTAESFFALLKRGHYGISHSLSKQHLFRYANEFTFRWNNRKITIGERMIAGISGAEGKRLMYREPPGGISG
ncbi:MAG: IS1595 family transposase [Pseudomonadota bacterium]